jgi:uncharacterized protein (DUF924 family)
MSDIERILGFWLDEVGPNGWYQSSEAIDARIAADFRDLWDRAMAGGLIDWPGSARGALAYLILTDQFPRNMFRGTGRAFASDGLARRVAGSAIWRGLDLATAEPQRQFFYLPLMHSEVLPDQERSIRLILTRMPETGRKNNLPHALQHREVIRRFGRFPSRNRPLGRRDTEAERAYRATGGYMA